jgi:hypothetical protein
MIVKFNIWLPRGMSGQGGSQNYYPATELENQAWINRLDEAGIYYIDLGTR